MSIARPLLLLSLVAVAVPAAPPALAQTGTLFYPLTPCRIVDTRFGGGGELTAGVSRTYVVNSGGPGFDYTPQGGSVGCGIPADARSVFFNFVVVTPSGPGFFRAWPAGSALPNASISNFANVPGLNIANGIAVGVCTPGPTACTGDLNVQVDQANAQLVIDVVGYFR